MTPTDPPDDQPAGRPAGSADPAELAELVSRAVDGRQDAWRALVDRYARLVWAVARSYRLGDADAADVSQTTWLRLAEHLHRLREPSRLPAWLATTARREALRVIAARRREAPDEVPEQPDQAPTPETRVVTGDRDRLLWQALGELSERCQQLLRVLACAPDLSYAEVGRSLRMPIGSIGPTRRRCLDTLRPLVAATGEGGGDQRSDGVASGRAGTR